MLSEAVLLKSDSCSQLHTHMHTYKQMYIYKLLYYTTFYCGEAEGTYSSINLQNFTIGDVEQS